MAVVVEGAAHNKAPPGFIKLIGPGLFVAAAGIGAGDIVSATMAGAGLGLTLLWAVVLATILKRFLNEGIARWQLATDTTALEGWCTKLPRWVGWYFGVYLVVWTVSVSISLASACGLGLATLTNGAVPRPVGTVLHALLGGVFVMIGGFKGFEKVMRVLITVMFFSIVACAALTFPGLGEVFKGTFVPVIPAGSGASVLSVLGGIGGSIGMLAYNYWLREERMVGPQWLRFVRADLTIAYVFTAIFGMSVMIIANQAFHVPGIQITNAQAVTRMAETLGAVIGPVGFYAYAIGFWAAVFASLLGIWQSVPYLFADFYGIMRGFPKSVRDQLTTVRSTPYRAGLVFISVAAVPFAFLDQPLFMIRTFTIVGSLFIPFLAATLLYLNNRHIPVTSGVPRNTWVTNAVLAFTLVVFTVIVARDAGALLR